MPAAFLHRLFWVLICRERWLGYPSGWRADRDPGGVVFLGGFDVEVQAGDLFQRGVAAAAEDPGVHCLDVFPAGRAGVHAVPRFFFAVKEEQSFAILVAAEGAQEPPQGPLVPAEAAEKKPLTVAL